MTQKENFDTAKKSLSANRDEIHARLEITVTCMKKSADSRQSF